MTDSIAGELTQGGHRLRQRIYFEDTDFSGLVYHARYLHFMERGRSDFLRLQGIHHSALATEGLAFAVRHMEIDYLKPARIDDVIEITTRLRHAGGARLVLDQSVARESDLLVEAKVTIALVAASGRAVRIPAAIRAVLASPEPRKP